MTFAAACVAEQYRILFAFACSDDRQFFSDTYGFDENDQNAQVGNWLSWCDSESAANMELPEEQRLNTEELLKRTVLYKVGHHGSHNSTLMEKGLKRMKHPELVAMIPVDEKWARARKPHEWKMPKQPLFEDLVTRTKGRFLRCDHGISKHDPDLISTTKWDEFAKRCNEKKVETKQFSLSSFKR